MTILALESSAKPASAAICSDGELLGQYFQNSGLTHSRTLLSMAQSLLNNLGIQVSGIDLIAVSHGPGSFTGVRIGVSAAKGLAWGAGIPVCGVSTLEAMAYQTQEPDVLLCPVMDARRSQVYNALFYWKDGAPVRLCGDRAISLEDLTAELRAYVSSDALPDCKDCSHNSLVPNPEFQIPNPAIYLVGDGALMSYEHLKSAGLTCRLAPELMRYQTAYGAALAAMHAEPMHAAELEPVYLRPSQAERERAACSHS